jgi:hypothetical protein
LRGAGLYPFLDAPDFSQHGGTFSNQFILAMTASAGTIYYTTNGSDPRLAGGGISPGALVYSGPITLTGSRRVLARVFHTNTWSAVNDAVFIESTPIPLRVTEIMYNPKVFGGVFTNSEDLEYLEIKNTGAQSINLAGFRLHQLRARRRTIRCGGEEQGPLRHLVGRYGL